jgi:hypothetical protein
LETLVLRIGVEDLVQDATMGALLGLLPNLQERFPVLRKIRLEWHKTDDYPVLKELQVIAAFKEKGVTITSSRVPPMASAHAV